MITGWATGLEILGKLLEIPSHAGDREQAASEEVSGNLAAWAAAPCCHGVTPQLPGEITLTLPDGWTLDAAPALDPMDALWLQASTTLAASPNVPSATHRWHVDIRLPRGVFPANTQEQRLSELNGLSRLFLQPLLIKTEG